MIGVVQVGLGNIASVHNMFRRLGILTRPVERADDIRTVRGLVLPGVGAFDAGMRMLEERDLAPAIVASVQSGLPLLGICLGMQLLCASSEEGTMQGLGILQARVVSLRHDRPDVVIPHVGWSDVETDRPSVIFPETAEYRFYFTHSYAVQSVSGAEAIGRVRYGGVPFIAAIRAGRTIGVQFHPEKSHRYGMGVLQRFWEDVCCDTD